MIAKHVIEKVIEEYWCQNSKDGCQNPVARMFPSGVLVAEGSFLIAHSTLTVGIMQVGMILKDDKNKYNGPVIFNKQFNVFVWTFVFTSV